MEPIDKLLLVEVEGKLFEFVVEAEHTDYKPPTLERVNLMILPLRIASPSILLKLS
jgi:hypothetical protein